MGARPGWLAVVTVLLIGPTGPAPAQVLPRHGVPVFSDEEKLWIQRHPTITLGLDDRNPPMNFRDDNGDYAGISVDYVQLISEKSGLDIRLLGSTWDLGLTAAMAHKMDGIMTASEREERKAWLNFTAPYFQMPLGMLTRRNFRGVQELKDFNPDRIAIVRGTVRVSLVREHCPQSPIVEVDNPVEGAKLVNEGRVEAFFDDLPVVQHVMDSLFLTDLKVALLLFDPSGASRFALRNDQPELLSIFDKTIASISAVEHRRIQDKWRVLVQGTAVQRLLPLTPHEKAWLRDHPQIRVATDSQWPPVEWRGQDGEYRGITVDYLRRVEQMLGVRMEIMKDHSWPELLRMGREGEVDLFTGVAPTPERAAFLEFTRPFQAFPVVIFAGPSDGFLVDLKALAGKRVAVLEGHAIEDHLRREWPDIHVVPLKTTEQAMRLLLADEVTAYVGGLLPTAHHLTLHPAPGIHVAGETPYAFELSFGVRKDWPELVSILQKALDAIPLDERERIYSSNVLVRYEHGINYAALIKLGFPVLLVLALIAYWNRRLASEVKRREAVEAELVAHRHHLEQLVHARTADLETALHKLQRLATAIEQSAEMVVITSDTGLIQYVNPAFERLTGYQAPEVCGRCMHLFLDDALNRDEITHMREDIRQTGKWQGHVTNRRKDGTTYQAEATISAVRDGDGTIINYVSIQRDVTRERALEVQLRQSQKLEALGTLAGGIAHDFNNILTAILGFSQLVVSDLPAGSVNHANMEEVLQAGGRAKELVRQILTFARRSQVENTPVLLAAIVHESVKLLRASLPPTVDIRVDVQSQACVMGNATQLHQIVVNLCTNAGKAMPDGGVLGVALQDGWLGEEFAAKHVSIQPGRYVHLSISDTGVGMVPEILARIFDPFFTTRGVEEGTGMGLSVVHGIVAQCKGAIEVQSQPGAGSIFHVYLPVAHAGESPDRAVESELPGGKERILFVDDEESVARLGERMLSRLGYQVTTFVSSVEALAAFGASPNGYDLVITDMIMPHLSGDQLAEALLAIRADVPIIICTGYCAPCVEAGILQRGVRCLLFKPLVLGELARSVREVLAQPERVESRSACA